MKSKGRYGLRGCIQIWLLLTAIHCMFAVQAQTKEIDSLKKRLATTKDDPTRITVLESLSYAYLSSAPDTALKYALKGLQLSKDINYRKGEAICINALGNVYFHIGDNAKALQYYLEYLKIKEELNEWKTISIAYYNIAGVYTEEKNYTRALEYFQKAKLADEKVKDTSGVLYDNYALGSLYQRMQRGDSALFYLKQSYRLAQLHKAEDMMGAILSAYGTAYLSLHDTIHAQEYFRLSIPYAQAVGDDEVLTSNYLNIARIFYQNSIQDSALLFARKALNIAKEAHFYKELNEINKFLTDFFKERKQYDSAFYYLQATNALKDSLFSEVELRKVQSLELGEQQRQQSIETTKIDYQHKIRLFTVIFVSAIFLIIAVLLWRNNRHKQKAYNLLQKQKAKTDVALQELKSTQAQLIQSEKMASLGQLTAGIAHEIQNPLNFVNNFSEVNSELLNDLENEAGKGNIEEVIAITRDVIENEQKIIHHGKRAEGIVKGMLQHSRASTGMRELTDINALVEECVRLSYHGMRAKYKEFNAVINTDLDESIGKINIVSEDIRRVLLNIINNAFYAVDEKKKQLNEAFEPAIAVCTKKLDGKIGIHVKDNGNGIPQKIVDKIFQPFFTTKPTGQGTGLGLSLSYDIIKAHGGEIEVKSKEWEGCEFTIQLPVR
jgi:two-component system NtrC family sensor kinase